MKGSRLGGATLKGLGGVVLVVVLEVEEALLALLEGAMLEVWGCGCVVM